jgi:hypothetical protein
MRQDFARAGGVETGMPASERISSSDEAGGHRLSLDRATIRPADHSPDAHS